MTERKKSYFNEQQIMGFLKQSESGLAAEEARRLKDLEVENARRKKLLAAAHLDLEAFKVGFGVKR